MSRLAFKPGFRYNIATMNTGKSEDKSIGSANDVNLRRFYHGTKADLKHGDLIEPGFNSNYGKRNKAKYVYFSETLDAAIWGAELSIGETVGKKETGKGVEAFESDELDKDGD